MRGFLLASAITLSASMASAEAHIQPPQIPSQLPENTAICTGGGLVAAAATSSTGIGVLPALVLVLICAIAVDDVRWHLDGGVHSD